MEIELSGQALALIPIIIALVALAKKYMNAKWAPLLSLGLGIAGAFLIPQEMWQGTVIMGAVMGLTASGLYSGGKGVVKMF